MTAAALAAFATCDRVGASALFLVTDSSTPTPGSNSASVPPPLMVLRQLGFAAPKAEHPLYDAGCRRVDAERHRGRADRADTRRRGLTIYPDFQYALISPGTAMPGWQQPQRPIRVPWPG
jgi:hypothetical protein